MKFREVKEIVSEVGVTSTSVGKHCRWKQNHLHPTPCGGETTPLPLPSSTSGSPWCLHNRAHRTRLNSAFTETTVVHM